MGGEGNQGSRELCAYMEGEKIIGGELSMCVHPSPQQVGLWEKAQGKKEGEGGEDRGSCGERESGAGVNGIVGAQVAVPEHGGGGSHFCVHPSGGLGDM